MKKLHETHTEYILDALEEDRLKTKNKILAIAPEIEYDLNRIIEVTIEIVELNK